MSIIKDGITVWISPIQVMQSAAGHYLGHSCVTLEYFEEGEPPVLLPQPYDRQTEYMTQPEAEALLVHWLANLDESSDE